MHYGKYVGPCADNVTYPMYHPVKNCKVNTYSSSLVPHIHPTHTTYVNHHTTKHAHLYPHSTSYANTYQQVDLGPVAGIAPAYGACPPKYPSYPYPCREY